MPGALEVNDHSRLKRNVGLTSLNKSELHTHYRTASEATVVFPVMNMSVNNQPKV
jgi:hypothetical protein